MTKPPSDPTSKPMSKQPPKKPRVPTPGPDTPSAPAALDENRLLRRPNFANPALLFLVIMIPVIAGIAFGFRDQPPLPESGPEAAVQAAEAAQAYAEPLPEMPDLDALVQNGTLPPEALPAARAALEQALREGRERQQGNQAGTGAGSIPGTVPGAPIPPDVAAAGGLPRDSVGGSLGMPGRRRAGAEPAANACPYGYLVGAKADESVVMQLRERGLIYRILKPGAMMTMDHSPSRLNLDVDDQGVIRRAWCG